MTAVAHYRLFVPISLPEQIKDTMAAAQSELRQSLPERSVSWANPKQLHLTLKFLGRVEAAQVEALSGQLRAVCQEFAPLTLRARCVDTFPDARFPRVIWAGVTDGGSQLLKMQSAVETASRNFIAPEPEQKFTGHVTLGRVRRINRRDSKVLLRLLSGMADRVFGEWTASEIELMRSELASDGARHTSIGTVPLSRV